MQNFCQGKEDSSTVTEEYNCNKEVEVKIYNRRAKTGKIHKEQEEKTEQSSGNEYSSENENSLYEARENDKVLK
jgi:hypothetical protein